jgi:hypothetical protein
MSNEEINRAIAEHLGWTYGTIYIGDGLDFDEYSHAWRRNGKATLERPPNYCGDLNAMHEAENTLEKHQLWMVAKALVGIVHVDTPITHSTARQRAEAFLRTVGKWRGEE